MNRADIRDDLWIVCAMVLSLVTMACGEAPKCEAGLCPTGMKCSRATGLCRPVEAKSSTPPDIFGAFAALPGPGQSRSFVAWVPNRQSLAHIRHIAQGAEVSWIAGPARSGETVAAGRVSAAAATSSGQLHVAYTRDDGRLFYATNHSGAWVSESVAVVPNGRVGDALDIAVWEGAPAIVFSDLASGALGFAHRTGPSWKLQWVKAPATQGGEANLGSSIAISTFHAKIAIAAYDSVGKDLVVATRQGNDWLTSIVAGRHASSGLDSSDAGRPCALIRGVGGELIVAYRDASQNKVFVARSKGGHTQYQVVVDGTYAEQSMGLTRQRLVGTDLSLTLLATGRIALAYQDGSQMRIGVRRESATGKWEAVDVPPAKRPQLAPRVFAQVDGSAAVSWIELSAGGDQPGGELVTWSLGAAAGKP